MLCYLIEVNHSNGLIMESQPVVTRDKILFLLAILSTKTKVPNAPVRFSSLILTFTYFCPFLLCYFLSRFFRLKLMLSISIFFLTSSVHSLKISLNVLFLLYLPTEMNFLALPW